MSTRITECKGIGGDAAKDCVDSTESVAMAAPCTVVEDVCTLTTGDAMVTAKDPKTEMNDEEDEGCCDC